MEKEELDYVFNHYQHLTTPEEREALIGLIRMKGPSGHPNQRLGDLSENPTVRKLVALGDGLRSAIVERIVREHPNEVFFNRCPKCQALCRTPKARQCRKCGHDWH